MADNVFMCTGLFVFPAPTLPARIPLSSLCSGYLLSLAAAKRHFLAQAYRICNLLSLLPFEKLLFSVPSDVRHASRSAAGVRTTCDPELKPCCSSAGWSSVGMVPVDYL